MTDDHRLKTAVPCLRCKRSTKNASQICSNHRNVSTEAGSISPALTSLPNRNTNKQDIEQRNIDFITNAPVVSVEGHSAIIDEAFTLGSALTDDNGETFMTDLYDGQRTKADSSDRTTASSSKPEPQTSPGSTQKRSSQESGRKPFATTGSNARHTRT